MQVLLVGSNILSLRLWFSFLLCHWGLIPTGRFLGTRRSGHFTPEICFKCGWFGTTAESEGSGHSRQKPHMSISRPKLDPKMESRRRIGLNRMLSMKRGFSIRMYCHWRARQRKNDKPWILEGKQRFPCQCECACSVMSDSCEPMDCSAPGFSVHGILQARVLEWVAVSGEDPGDLPDPGIDLHLLQLLHSRQILLPLGH